MNLFLFVPSSTHDPLSPPGEALERHFSIFGVLFGISNNGSSAANAGENPGQMVKLKTSNTSGCPSEKGVFSEK